jgi:hypothetical protein
MHDTLIDKHDGYTNIHLLKIPMSHGKSIQAKDDTL